MAQKFQPGQIFRAKFKIDASAIESFAVLSGDQNPIHVDPKEAQAYGHSRQVAHGALLLAYLSKVIGMDVPGAGATWMGQSIEWPNPVLAGDEIEIAVTIENVSTGAGIIGLGVSANNQRGVQVMKGDAKVKVVEKLITETQALPTNQRTALVTGGSGGIGAAISKNLAASGLSVAVNFNQSNEPAKAIANEIVRNGGNAEIFQADISNPVDTDNLVQSVIGTFGSLDVVVHAASPPIPIVDASNLQYTDFEPYLKVYIGGAVALVSSAYELMAERKFGRFIFLGTSYIFGQPPIGLAGYISGKEALWGYTKSLATEFGPHGITVNMVSPGMTITELTSEVPARTKEVEARKTPVRRLTSVDDTANLVAFIASDSAGYINGANLPLTGGPI